MNKFLLVGVLTLASACAQERSSTPLPDFALTAVGPTGETPFGRAQMLGRPWVVDFIYTHCSGPCPLLSERLAALGAKLPPSIGLLSVSVDPQGDTPQRLRDYARAHGADLKRWVFLRGSLKQTYELLYAGFHLPLSTDASAAPESRVMHSTRFVLVDKTGRIFAAYDGLGDADNYALARDARRLLEVDL